jgi:Zn-dependent protease
LYIARRFVGGEERMIKLLLIALNAAKLGKILASGGTMLVSVFAYSLIFGWPYAVGFVVLIFVHEMGHYIAARRRGLEVGLPMFIPFVGAWVALKSIPHDAETEAYIGIWGPLAGTFGALTCLFLGHAADSRLLLALAYAGCFINLFNLIPLLPFDGGRISQVLSPKLWLVGMPILIGMFFWRPSPILILVALLAAPAVYRAIRGWKDQPPEYYIASPSIRMSYGALYLGLAAFLAILSYELSIELGAASTS